MILDAANGAESSGSPTTARLGAGLVAARATRSRTSTSQGQIVDLRMAQLDGHGPRLDRRRTRLDLTEVSGLDGASRPGWYVPADQLPAAHAGARARRPSASPCTDGSNAP